MRRWPGFYLACCVAMFAAVGTLAIASDNSSVDPSGAARKVAAEELAYLSHTSAEAFRLADPSVLKGATLDDPFLYYMADTTFWGYEHADPQDILRFTNWLRICFPVRVDNRIVGTINLMRANGSLEFASIYMDNGQTNRLEALAREAHLTSNQRVSLLQTNPTGFYFVIDDGTKVYQMTPVDDLTRRTVGVESSVSDFAALAPPSRYAGAIRKQIESARRRWLDSLRDKRW